MIFSVRSFIFVMNMARRQAALAKAGDLATLETLIAVYCIYERSQKFDIKDVSFQPTTNPCLIGRINTLMSRYFLSPFLFAF